MASEEVKTSESAASTIVNLSEEAKLVREGVKTPGPALLSIFKSLFSGGVAGGVSRTSVAPLERLKILLQSDFTFEIAGSKSPPYTIQWNDSGLKYIWRTEGLRGLFKGNGTYCARIVPNSAVKFFSYEEDPTYSSLRLGAGACAGIIAMSATYPMDMVRGRLTVQVLSNEYLPTDKSPRQYRGIAHALSTVLMEEGPRALYKDWVPSVIGVIPYVGLNFAVYESLKDWLVKTKPFGLVEDNELGVARRLACGAAAGTVGQTVAYPLDVIRQRMQMVGWKDTASVVTGDRKGKTAIEYTGMVDAFRKTVRHEGLEHCTKDWAPIHNCFVTYEMVEVVLGVEMRISD
ncbi:mitochondrial adenine nucleotide transporter ADNT [Salix suchowensis]|nr:mitochondrial adenine nucleotide transporter ADNT [Salix suchowensis]